MTFGSIKHRFSFLTVFIIITINLATFAQVSPDNDPNRSANPSPIEPWRIRLPSLSRSTDSDGIDAVNSRVNSANSEGLDRVWQMTGPFGGDVTALAIDPRNADSILLGTSDGQIYRSTDGGAIWRRIRPGIKAAGFTVTVLLFDRERPEMIYAGVKAVTILGEETKGGSIFVSEDNGQNWREFDGMHGRPVRGLVQSVKDPNVLVAGTVDGIYRTLDRGGSWERITPANDPELRGFHSVATDPRDVDVIYVGTNHLPWKTVDGGKNWKLAGSKKNGVIEDSDIMAIHIDEANPDIVLMSACSGIYRSLDASENWTKIQGIPYTSRRTLVIYQHPTKPEVIFAGTTEGLWLSANGGKPDSWQRVTSLRLVINAVAIHPDRPERVFLGTQDNGVMVSNDGGETYDPSNAGFINRQVRAVLADQKERGRVYSGVIFDGVHSGFFVSEDGGLTWQQSMSGMGIRDVYSLYQPPTNPETIYAGTNHGLYRSDDQGRNWAAVKREEIKEEAKVEGGEKKDKSEEAVKPDTPPQPQAQPTPPSTRPRRVKPDQPSESNSQNLEPIVFTRAMTGLQGSSQTSRTKTQAKVQTRRPTQSSNQVGQAKQAKGKGKKAAPVAKKSAQPPSDLVDLQSQVFALVPFTPRRDADNGTSEGGEAASQSESQPNSQSQWLIASTWHGLFRTEDEKKGWKEIKLRPSGSDSAASTRKPHINAIATSPHAPGVIFIGTEDGLFVSRDNGSTFNLTPLEDEVRRVRYVAFDPRTAETIFIGTTTGFFRSTDGGRSWENRGGGMPLLTDVSAIAINTVNPDEIYAGDDLRGGFYYSKDSGKNWEKLDISQLPSTKIWSLSSDPFDRNRLYVGTFSGGVYVMSRR
jgi:photosystem II stability/assembly factor-like uncharacterized protein